MLHQIGAGTLGPVFRAYDSARERLVAVKLFKLDLPPERAHQLVAEFERLIDLDLTHPALAAPLATGLSGVSAFLVQEYVAADSLDLAIREHGPAPASDVLRLAARLAGALDAAAEVDVTHGALHPRDVLLASADGKLTGFGVTRALERIGVAAPVRRPYTAPERLAGGEWGRRADLFSLAALMHELMWGRRVTGLGAQAADGLTEIAGADLQMLRATYARALAEHPAERYETAVEFVEALTRACPDAVASPAPAAAPKRRAARNEEPRLPLDEEVPQNEEAAQEAEVAHGIQPALGIDAGELRLGTPTRDAREGRSPADLPLAAPSEPPMAIPAGLLTDHDPDERSALDRSRSAIWPLVLALVVGIAIGFGGGYAVGSHDQPLTPAAPSAPAPVAAGREFTESRVAPAQNPATAPAPNPIPGPKPASTPAAPSAEVGSRTSEVGSPKPQPDSQKSGVRNLKSPAGRLTGALVVESRPTGARVYLDGKLVGTTPLSLAAVRAAPHKVRIERSGYRRWSSSFRIAAGEQNRVTASLER